MAIKVGVSTVSAALRKLLAEITAFINRVTSDGGEIVSESALRSQVKRSVIALEPSLYAVANGRKAGVLYSILPESGAGDFSVTRAGTTAMELNAEGYWQPVAANVPRFNFVSELPTLLVEEARTNLLTYPKNFADSYWTKSGASIEGDPNTAGAEKVTNGGFDTDTGWTKGVGHTISGGTLNINTVTGSFTYQLLQNAANNLCLITFTISNYSRGSVRLYIGNSITPYYNSNGTYTHYVFATVDNNLYIQAASGGFVGSIDNVIVKPVTGYASPFVDSLGDNLLNGYKLIADSANGYIRLATAASVTAATTYANSIFIKRITGSGAVSLIDVNGADQAVTITNEWQRFEYAAAAGGASGQTGVKLATAGDEVLIAHAQLEEGTAASSPIGGAEGATQTRNADSIVKTGASALIGQTEGWVLFESDSDDIEVYGLVAIGASKALFNYNETDIELYADGELVDSASGNYNWTMDSVTLGNFAGGYLNGRLKVLALGKTKLTAAVAAILT